MVFLRPFDLDRLRAVFLLGVNLGSVGVRAILWIARLAEREGFEPSRPLRACRFSRAVPSTTQPPLQVNVGYEVPCTISLFAIFSKDVSISSPDRPHRLAWSRTAGFQSVNRGSNPRGVTKSCRRQQILTPRFTHIFVPFAVLDRYILIW